MARVPVLQVARHFGAVHCVSGKGRACTSKGVWTEWRLTSGSSGQPASGAGRYPSRCALRLPLSHNVGGRAIVAGVSSSSRDWRRLIPNWVFAVSLLVLVGELLATNGPTGSGEAIEGHVDGPCTVSRYGTGAVQCTARLIDGAVVRFAALGDTPNGSPVLFKRFQRRFVGSNYAVAGHSPSPGSHQDGLENSAGCRSAMACLRSSRSIPRASPFQQRVPCRNDTLADD